MVETEFLYSGRIGFILGRRGKFGQGYQKAGIDQLLGFEASAVDGTLVNSRQQNMLHQFAVGGVDQHTMQRMCSLEYLERYFHYVLRTKAIDLGDQMYAANGDVPNKYKSGAVAIVGSAFNALDGGAVIRRIQDAERGQEVEPAKRAKVAASGIFAGDDGPFLRGKTLESTIAPYRRNMQRASLAIGDRIAFEALESKLKDIGAMDWTPDGIVLSKLDSGAGSDRLADDVIDARDGQLYNITIGGPAITSSWTGDPKMEVLPLDKLYIVLVGDVWTGKTKTDIGTVWKEDAAERKTPSDPRKLYEAQFLAWIKVDTDDRKTTYLNGKSADSKRGKTLTENIPTNQTITNIRVKRMTSSQMIAYSAYAPGRENSRIGLKVGLDGGEYILGGWCIGTVLDSAAARAVPDGMSLVGSVKRARSSHAANLLVNIKWCSGDELYRQYMNRPSLGKTDEATSGLMRSRYDMRRRPLDRFNGPALKRS
jgi:hypothetical protein